MPMHRVSLLGLAACLVVALTASAHKPVSIGGTFGSLETALLLETIDVSQVVYSQFTSEDPELWLTFTLIEPAGLFLSLGLPAIERLAQDRPSVTVIGPGLPSVFDLVGIPDGYGGVTVDSALTGEPTSFHEPFTGTDSWILFEETIVVLQPGTYYVVARPRGNRYDKFWIAIGRREQFGLRDLISFPTIVRDVRVFHEVPPGRGSGVVGKLLFLAASGLGIWFLSECAAE